MENSVLKDFNLSHQLACRVVNKALEVAFQEKKDISIAVVDRAGNLVSFGRSDTAAILSVNVAIDKAYSAAISGKATHEWQNTVAEDEPIRYGVPGSIPRLMTVGGGMLIAHDGHVIGAIGVSGAHWDGDRAIGEQTLGDLGLMAMASGEQPQEFQLEGENCTQ